MERPFGAFGSEIPNAFGGGGFGTGGGTSSALDVAAETRSTESIKIKASNDRMFKGSFKARVARRHFMACQEAKREERASMASFSTHTDLILR
jgi:hypothetical protein